MDAENGNVEMTEIDNFQIGHGSHVRLEDFEFDFGDEVTDFVRC